MHPSMHYVSISLVQNAVCTCCPYVGKCEKGFVWSNRREKLTYVNPRMHGNTDKEAQVWRGSLVSLSFQPRSSLRGCLCFSLSHHRRSQSCSYHHYALHCSHECGMVAWQCGHVQRISITWMGRTQSVSRLVDARGPVDLTIVWGSLRLAPTIVGSHLFQHMLGAEGVWNSTTACIQSRLYLGGQWRFG